MMLDTPEDNGLASVAAALGRYLEEIDGYRRLCDGHRSTAAIRTPMKWLQVARSFEDTPDMVRRLQEVLQKLQPWEESYYWARLGTQWEAFKKRSAAHITPPGGAIEHLVLRGFVWMHTPVLGHVYRLPGHAGVSVELSAPPLPTDLPVLPLRALALLLDCHESLVPPRLAAAIPLKAHQQAKSWTVKEYLSRTMPPRLYASRDPA
jgi:hypothetical protein